MCVHRSNERRLNKEKVQDGVNILSVRTMDACEAVEKELLRVITKFTCVHDHANRVLNDVTKNFEDLQSSIAEGNVFRGFLVRHFTKWRSSNL